MAWRNLIRHRARAAVLGESPVAQYMARQLGEGHGRYEITLSATSLAGLTLDKLAGLDAVFLDADLGNVEGRLHSPTILSRSNLSLTDRWFGVADGVDLTLTGDVLLDGANARLDMGGSWYAYVAGLYYRVSVTSPPAEMSRISHTGTP